MNNDIPESICTKMKQELIIPNLCQCPYVLVANNAIAWMTDTNFTIANNHFSFKVSTKKVLKQI